MADKAPPPKKKIRTSDLSDLTVLSANLNTEPPEFYRSLLSVIIILVMQLIIPISSVPIFVVVQTISKLPSLTSDPDR